MGRLGHVAIDSTRVHANALRRRRETEKELRRRLAQTRRMIRRWEQQGDAADPNEEPGTRVKADVAKPLEEQIAATREKFRKLRQLGARQLSVTDNDSRFLHKKGGEFILDYTVDLAVSDDHLTVGQRTTQAVSDSDSLLPMVKQVETTWGERPAEVSADSAFFSVQNLQQLERWGIAGYVPDAHLTGELQQRRAPLKTIADSPVHRRMRDKLRSPAGQARYRRRQTLVEPVFGVLKEQRGMRHLRLRGLSKAGTEVALYCTAFNLTRMWRGVRHRCWN